MIRLLAGLLVVAACTPEAPARVIDSPPGAAALPPDSLVLTLADSTTVWLTPGRIGHAADGTTCREFGVRVGTHVVPLLFVREAPRLDRADHLLAELARDCKPLATYEIDPATAQPTKRDR